MRVLGTVGNIPSYVMTGKLTPLDFGGYNCGYGQIYRGDELARLTDAMLKRINLNEVTRLTVIGLWAGLIDILPSLISVALTR